MLMLECKRLMRVNSDSWLYRCTWAISRYTKKQFICNGCRCQSVNLRVNFENFCIKTVVCLLVQKIYLNKLIIVYSETGASWNQRCLCQIFRKQCVNKSQSNPETCWQKIKLRFPIYLPFSCIHHSPEKIFLVPLYKYPFWAEHHEQFLKNQTKSKNLQRAMTN